MGFCHQHVFLLHIPTFHFCLLSSLYGMFAYAKYICKKMFSEIRRPICASIKVRSNCAINLCLFMKWCYKKKAKQYYPSIEFLGQKQQHVTKETAREPLEKNSYRINEKEAQSNTVGYDQPGDMSYKAEQSGSSTMVCHQPDIQKIGEKNCQPKNSEITEIHGMNAKEMSSSAEESMGILHINLST